MIDCITNLNLDSWDSQSGEEDSVYESSSNSTSAELHGLSHLVSNSDVRDLRSGSEDICHEVSSIPLALSCAANCLIDFRKELAGY